MYLTPADLEDPASVKEKTPAMTAGSNGETILLVENVSDVRSTC